MLKEAKVRISMDGKGRWIDNVFIERLRLPQPSFMPCWPPGGARSAVEPWIGHSDQSRAMFLFSKLREDPKVCQRR